LLIEIVAFTLLIEPLWGVLLLFLDWLNVELVLSCLEVWIVKLLFLLAAWYWFPWADLSVSSGSYGWPLLLLFNN